MKKTIDSKITKKSGLSKTKGNKTTKRKTTKNKSVSKVKNLSSKINFNVMLFYTFIVGLVLIVSTYAWFSSTLDATVDFVNITVNNETGLYISLDGINYSDKVTVGKDEVTKALEGVYPNHNNKWVSYKGFVPISSNGIPNADTFNFDFFALKKADFIEKDNRYYLGFSKFREDSKSAQFVAFDVFLKNITYSPKPDNLYLWEGTSFGLEKGSDRDVVSLFNSLRLGISKGGTTSDKNASANIVQNLQCNGTCQSVIYEPNSLNHSEHSIEEALDYGAELVDGEYAPTYGVIKEGTGLNHYTGYGLAPFDNEHFAFQETFTELNHNLFPIPHGVTKARIYIWFEGQDLDSLQADPGNDTISINIQLRKDNAGYN